jgi:hypothetical protein
MSESGYTLVTLMHGRTVTIITTHADTLQQLVDQAKQASHAIKVTGPSAVSKLPPSTPTYFSLDNPDGDMGTALWLVDRLCAQGWEVFQVERYQGAVGAVHLRIK